MRRLPVSPVRDLAQRAVNVIPPGPRGALERASTALVHAALRDTQPTAYVEIAIGYIVLVTLNLLLFREDNWGYFDANPHPFWLIIIPVAARYGAMPGYAAGAIAAILYVIFIVLQPRSVFTIDILSSQAILNPVLFLVVAGGLGELRESQKRAHKDLAARYDQIEADLQDLAQRYLTAVEINREMQRRIVAQASTVTTLYQAAKGLEELEIDQLAPAVLELVTTFAEAESCAVYLRQGNRFVLKAGRPEEPDFARPPELDVSQGMPAMALIERRTVTVRDLLSEASPAEVMRHRLLMMTPLIGHNDEVIGMLVVEKLPFLRFTPSAVKLFGLLGDWASTAFQTALRFQETRDRNIEDELTGAYSWSYWTKRLGQEVPRARQYGLALSVVAVRIEDYYVIPPVKLPSVQQALALVFRQCIRPIDILGKPPDADLFVIALPHMGPEEANALASRISHEVDRFGFKPFDTEQPLEVATSVSTLTPAVLSSDDLLNMAMRALPETDQRTRRIPVPRA